MKQSTGARYPARHPEGRAAVIKKKFLFVSCLICLFLSFSCIAFAADGGGGIFSGLASAANFIKRLFVPDKDFFNDQLSDINDLLNDRFGGIAYLYQLLHYFFSALGSATTSAVSFTLPDNYFFDGYRGMSIDVFQLAKPYINLLRGFLTAVYTLFVAVCCYHKVRTLFRE